MSVELMQYLPSPADAGGARKYEGAVAQNYDAKREQSDKWHFEQAAVEDMLDDLPKGSWVLDVPCGTGRFFELYHRKGFLFRAVDASADMLQIAGTKVLDPMKARLAQGDVRGLPIHDKSICASVMCRLTRWLSPEDCQVALKELQRVSRKKIIFTARVANHPHARPIELFQEALDGWKIARMVGSQQDPAYRVIMLEPEPASSAG